MPQVKFRILIEFEELGRNNFSLAVWHCSSNLAFNFLV